MWVGRKAPPNNHFLFGRYLVWHVWQAEVAKVVSGWRSNEAAAQAKILSSKAFNWQLLNCDFRPNATHTCGGAPQASETIALLEIKRWV